MPNPVACDYLTGQFANISAAPSTLYFCAPEPGSKLRVQITLNNAITVANTSITVKVDNVSLTGTLSIPFSGSAKGTTFSQEFRGSINAGSLIEVISAGSSTTTCIAPVTVTLYP